MSKLSLLCLVPLDNAWLLLNFLILIFSSSFKLLFLILFLIPGPKPLRDASSGIESL